MLWLQRRCNYLASSECFLPMQLGESAPNHLRLALFSHSWKAGTSEMAVWDHRQHLEWERGGATGSPAWRSRLKVFLSLNAKCTAPVGSTYCPHFLLSDDVFHYDSALALWNGVRWRLHLSKSTVLSWGPHFSWCFGTFNMFDHFLYDTTLPLASTPILCFEVCILTSCLFPTLPHFLPSLGDLRMWSFTPHF